MSLVNEMLRDLETRRAGASERPQLDELFAVDEAGAARRVRQERLRRSLIWFLSLCLIGALVGMMIGRIVIDWGGSAPQPLVPVVETPSVVTPQVVAPLPTQLIEVLPQHDGRRFQLQLLLDRAVAYQRSEESGAVSLLLSGVQLDGEARKGLVQRGGSSLSWRVEQRGEDVQVLVVGMGDQLTVLDRLESAGDRWQLWLEVPLSSVEPVAEVDLNALANTAAEPESEADDGMPAWATQPAQVAAPVPTTPVQAAAALPPAVPKSPKQMQMAGHQPDPMAQARQALLEQNYPRAISELESLHKRQGSNPEVVRLLAQAYLSSGAQARLFAWLPGQLQLMPYDSELRLLLARAQLQAGDAPAAIVTLNDHAPSMLSAPAYHALLAASYQQTGQWQESAATYRQLVASRPSQATWQLGLAIALEQLDQPIEAGRHYRRALQGQGLDDGSRRFAAERGAVLGEP